MELHEMYSIMYPFDERILLFDLDDKLFITCYYDYKELFCIHDDDKLSISNFLYTRYFFRLSNAYSDFSKAEIESCNGIQTYSLKILNEMTSHAFTRKLNEIAEAFKLQERTDISGRKIYEAFKNCFPEDEPIKLIFVD